MNMGMHSGVAAAIAAAILFGAGTPLAKLLLAYMSPWLLAAMLYYKSTFNPEGIVKCLM